MFLWSLDKITSSLTVNISSPGFDTQAVSCAHAPWTTRTARHRVGVVDSILSNPPAVGLFESRLGTGTFAFLCSSIICSTDARRRSTRASNCASPEDSILSTAAEGVVMIVTLRDLSPESCRGTGIYTVSSTEFDGGSSRPTILSLEQLMHTGPRKL